MASKQWLGYGGYGSNAVKTEATPAPEFSAAFAPVEHFPIKEAAAPPPVAIGTTGSTKPDQASSDANEELIKLQTAIAAAESKIQASQAAAQVAEQRAKTAEAAAAAAESKIQASRAAAQAAEQRANTAEADATTQRASSKETLAKLNSERSSEKSEADKAVAQSKKEVAQLKQQLGNRWKKAKKMEQLTAEMENEMLLKWNGEWLPVSFPEALYTSNLKRVVLS